MRESSSLLPPEPWPQRISRILAWIGGAIILVGCSGLITIDVITRYLFKRGMVESFEMSGYALAACIGLGLGFATTSKTHIRVDILLAVIPRHIAWYCEWVADFLALACCLIIMVYGFSAAASSYKSGSMVIKTLVTPEWWALTPLPVAFALLAIEVLFRMQRLYNGPRRPRDDAVSAA